MDELDRHWRLNGTRIGDFRGLSEDRIANLKPVGTFSGVHVFASPDCPRGTLELWDRGARIAIIEGIAETA